MLEIKTFMRKAYMTGARYSGLSALLRPLLSGVGAILMFHHIRPDDGSPVLNGFLHVEPQFLDRLLDDLARQDILFVSMDEMADRLASGHLDQRFVALTLDDGYRDNLVHAAPVFRAHAAPFTVYASPGLIDGTADVWWEHLERVVLDNDAVTYETPGGPATLHCPTPRAKRHAYDTLVEYALGELDEDEQRAFTRRIAERYGFDFDAYRAATVLDWNGLRALDAEPLATIGAHTINHFRLRRLPREQALDEIVRSADEIERMLGVRPRHLAYPYGKADAAGPREVELAREAGFVSAVTTRHGVLMPAHAGRMHELPRISVNGYYQDVHYIDTMLSGITMPAANCGRTFVTV